MSELTLPLDFQAIKKMLPHRYPLLLVDRITELEAGKFAKGFKNITGNEDIFNGHFPQQAIFPGVMICEAMAQVAGVLGYVTTGHSAEDGYLMLFAGLDKVRFKRQVVPGDKMDMEAVYLRGKRGVYKVACTASVNGELVCNAELMFAEKKV